jgi:hypothetical protein
VTILIVRHVGTVSFAVDIVYVAHAAISTRYGGNR